MSESTYVSYSNFQYTSITPTSPQSKQIPNQPGQNYQEIVLQYNYGTKEQPKVSEFLMEWPEVYSNGGIIKKVEPTQGGKSKEKMSYSVMVNLPQTGETKVLTDRLNEAHMACAYIIGQYKGALKMYDFDHNRPGGLFKNPIYYPRDQVTGNLIEGKNPSIYLKLFKRGFGATEEKTLFTDLSGNPIRWELLEGVEMRFIPLVQFEKIYVGGGKASLQLKIVSAVVTWIAAKNTVTKQTDTIKHIINSNPKAAETLAEQIAKLTMDRQHLLLSNTGSNLDGRSYQSAVHNLSAMPSLPTVPPSGTTTNISDFLQGAPNLKQESNNPVGSPAKTPMSFPAPVKLN